MSVMFSRACEYAIRGLVQMARDPEREFWRIQELAELTNTPAPFLAKTFQSLSKSQILTSSKGRNGGFSFDKPPDNVFILEVVKAIDGDELTKECALGLPKCGNENPCPLHEDWDALRQSLIDLFLKKTIMDLAK